MDEADLEGPLLLVEDAFGALATALGSRAGASWGDSVLGERATAWNLERNHLPPLPWIPATRSPEERFAGALVRVPRSLRRLRWWLSRLPAALEPGAPVWIAGRAGDVTKRVLSAAEGLGPAESSLQRHKSRVVRTRSERSPAPPAGRDIEAAGLRLRPAPGVFGEDGLDEGTALLLRCLDAAPRSIVDLGCGSGVLGLAAADRWPAASLTFTDSSYLAVDSAEAAFAMRSADGEHANFVVCDAGDAVSEGADLVLCNPPFHAGRARTRAVAARMFGQSARLLGPGGALWVVGNRHLDYHLGLQRWFEEVSVRSGDPRFAVLEARRPRWVGSEPSTWTGSSAERERERGRAKSRLSSSSPRGSQSR